MSIQALTLAWNDFRIGGDWIIYVAVHNSYLLNIRTSGIMQLGSTRKRCYYFILGCHSPLSFPFILPRTSFRYAIDHFRCETAGRGWFLQCKHVKIWQHSATGTFLNAVNIKFITHCILSTLLSGHSLSCCSYSCQPVGTCTFST